MFKPQLTDPLKVIDTANSLLHKPGSHIFSMNLNHDEGGEYSALHL